jgi:alpha-tubulin suppressor-like RCC1 family protein
MTARHLLAIGCFSLLAGCGTLQVNIDKQVTAPPATKIVLPEYPPTFTLTPTITATPTVTEIPTPTDTPSPTSIPAVTVPIAAGKNHTCAVTAGLGVKCWGNNEHGQLGDGTTINRPTPVDVRGLGSEVIALTAGWGNTCALTAGGGVWCWGYNQNGELGNGGTIDGNVPTPVSGLESGVKAIESGDDHTCAVTAEGALKCWGFNEYGQLGDGTKISRDLPVAAGGLNAGVQSAAAGWGHTCILTDAGAVKCWGNNEYGQLGYGQDAEVRFTPVDVDGLGGGVIAITADGGSNCALIAGGGMRCWGNNQYGQLGDGTAENRIDPVAVSGMAQGVAKAAAGWNHTCAIGGTGELWCWGWNFYGQLGTGTKNTRLTPRLVTGLAEGVVSVALGAAHTCAATNLGKVACWGSNADGQLGNGTTNDGSAPVFVPGLETALPPGAPSISATPGPLPTALQGMRIPLITAGSAHTCLRTAGGGVKCWGYNRFGQLGDDTTADRNQPVEVSGLTAGVTAVEAGLWHTCALTVQGAVKCWGNNEYGQLGDGTRENRTKPVDVAGLSSGVVALAAGTAHTCALTSKKTVKCWGWNQSGQLGDGTTRDRSTPADVPGLAGVVALTSGAEHNCVLTAAGGVACWGSHSGSIVGEAYARDTSVPLNVPGLESGVTSLISGAFFNCAVMDGVACWGSNTFGQFGDGTTFGQLAPERIPNLPDSLVPCAAGYGHTCGLSASGTAYCWGSNDVGQLGDGTRSIRLTPTPVNGLSGAVAFALGYGHTCVLTAAGGVKCWGGNSKGELGNGTNHNSLTPVDVIFP